ncbi:MAG: GNAT family N-acetyltransferase [Dehalococcoidia bacterium]
MTLQHTRAASEEFPKTVTLEDGTTLSVRILQPSDEDALLAFFQGIPEQERYWLREDVSDPAVIHQWVSEIDYHRVLPLIASRDEAIVADATLHRRGYGARHSLGEIRLVVAPLFRGRGLGYALLAELTEIAQRAGLDRLEAEIVSGAQDAALEAIELIGFEQVAVLPGHLRDRDGNRHDLLLLVYVLQE